MASNQKPALSRAQLIVLALVLVGACVLPFVVSNYRVFQFTLTLVYAIALLGLNMLTGYNGQISLGHGAFYAIGAYCAAILMDKYGVPYWATLPVAALVCLTFFGMKDTVRVAAALNAVAALLMLINWMRERRAV